MIVPLSGFSTDRMSKYQELVYKNHNNIYISYYSGDAHPSVMFSGVKYRLCIIIATKTSLLTTKQIYTTVYYRWYAEERHRLFQNISYTKNILNNGFLRFAKGGNYISLSILSKIVSTGTMLENYLLNSGIGHVTYHRSPVFWIRSMDFEPYFQSDSGKQRSTDHLKDLFFRSLSLSKRVGAILNSTIFYFWFTTQGNCRNIAEQDIKCLPTGDIRLNSLEKLESFFDDLMVDLKINSKRRVYNYSNAGRVEYDEFYPSLSKVRIDPIDQLLAEHYGLTDEETDFIINYDIKYRMSSTDDEE